MVENTPPAGRWSTTVGPAAVVALALMTVALVAFGPYRAQGQPNSFFSTILIPLVFSASTTTGHPLTPPRPVAPWVVFLALFGLASGWTAVVIGDGSPRAVLICGVLAGAVTPWLGRRIARAREKQDRLSDR